MEITALSGSDFDEIQHTGDLAHSQTLLGHKNRDMTEHYVKARAGARVKPLR